MKINSRNKRSALILVFVVLSSCALVMTAGCDGGRESRPQDVAQKFLTDLRFREQEAVFEAIWPPARQVLEETYQEMAQGVEGELSLKVEELVEATKVHSAFLVRRADVQGDLSSPPADGDKVVVMLEYRDARSASIPMRFGDGRWYVDLPVHKTRGLDGPPGTTDVNEEHGEQGQDRFDSVDDEMSDDE